MMQAWTAFLGNCLAKFITVEHWNEDEEPSFYIPRQCQLSDAQLLEMFSYRIREGQVFIAKPDGSISTVRGVDVRGNQSVVLHSISSLIKLKDDSITFVEEAKGGTYSLQFMYTSTVDCFLDVYFNCRDESDLKNISLRCGSELKRMHLPCSSTTKPHRDNPFSSLCNSKTTVNGTLCFNSLACADVTVRPNDMVCGLHSAPSSNSSNNNNNNNQFDVILIISPASASPPAAPPPPAGAGVLNEERREASSSSSSSSSASSQPVGIKQQIFYFNISEKMLTHGIARPVHALAIPDRFMFPGDSIFPDGSNVCTAAAHERVSVAELTAIDRTQSPIVEEEEVEEVAAANRKGATKEKRPLTLDGVTIRLERRPSMELKNKPLSPIYASNKYIIKSSSSIAVTADTMNISDNSNADYRKIQSTNNTIRSKSANGMDSTAIGMAISSGASDTNGSHANNGSESGFMATNVLRLAPGGLFGRYSKVGVDDIVNCAADELDNTGGAVEPFISAAASTGGADTDEKKHMSTINGNGSGTSTYSTYSTYSSGRVGEGDSESNNSPRLAPFSIEDICLPIEEANVLLRYLGSTHSSVRVMHRPCGIELPGPRPPQQLLSLSLPSLIDYFSRSSAAASSAPSSSSPAAAAAVTTAAAAVPPSLPYITHLLGQFADENGVLLFCLETGNEVPNAVDASRSTIAKGGGRGGKALKTGDFNNKKHSVVNTRRSSNDSSNNSGNSEHGKDSSAKGRASLLLLVEPPPSTNTRRIFVLPPSSARNDTMKDKKQMQKGKQENDCHEEGEKEQHQTMGASVDGDVGDTTTAAAAAVAVATIADGTTTSNLQGDVNTAAAAAEMIDVSNRVNITVSSTSTKKRSSSSSSSRTNTCTSSEKNSNSHHSIISRSRGGVVQVPCCTRKYRLSGGIYTHSEIFGMELSSSSSTTIKGTATAASAFSLGVGSMWTYTGELPAAAAACGGDDDGHGGEKEGGNECSVCLTNKMSVLALPCRHLCLCKECAVQLTKTTAISTWTKCPICRNKAVFFVDIEQLAETRKEEEDEEGGDEEEEDEEEEEEEEEEELERWWKEQARKEEEEEEEEENQRQQHHHQQQQQQQLAQQQALLLLTTETVKIPAANRVIDGNNNREGNEDISFNKNGYTIADNIDEEEEEENEHAS